MNKLTVLDITFEQNGNKGAIYPVILSDENEMILVDCGFPGFLPLLKQVAVKKDIDISKLTKVIITHHDHDHIGSLAELKREYPNIKVIASIEEEKYISGKEKSLRLKQAESIYDKLPEERKAGARDFHKILESVEKVDVDICVKDKDFIDCCGGIEIISTPGHMPGHISIYHKESKTLISGDALTSENGKLCFANPQYTLDMPKAISSIKKVLNYDIDRIVCYHGGVCTENIKELLKEM